MGPITNNIDSEMNRLRRTVERGERIDVVEISGNDPAEYVGLAELVREIRLLTGDSAIRLSTHGRTLADGDFARALVTAGVMEFIIPLYGHTSSVHDAVTRTPGSFVQSIRGLSNVVKAGARHTLTVLITKENQPFLTETLRFVASLVPEMSVGVPYLATEKFRDSVPNLDLLKSQLSDAIRAIRREGICVIRLRNLPRCLVSMDGVVFEESFEAPIGGYEHWRNEDLLNKGFVQLFDEKVVPRYRLFDKTLECASCIHERTCPGFFKTYIERGLFRPAPIVCGTSG